MFRRRAPCRVTFDGQSLVNNPAWEGDIFGFSWPRLAMAGTKLPGYDQPAVGGTSMTTLASNFATRSAPYIAPASFEPTIYVLCGGTQDVLDGDSGAQIYSDAGVLADLARGKGAQYVICTTVFPAGPFTGPQEAARVAANALILADASNKFDAQIDFDVEGLDDPSDPRSYFFDQVHLIGSHADPDHGTGRAAVVARPALLTAIEAVI